MEFRGGSLQALLVGRRDREHVPLPPVGSPSQVSSSQGLRGAAPAQGSPGPTAHSPFLRT